MSKIVLLHDVYAIKEQKERELAYYREQLEIIHQKLVWIEREYKLTKDIIKMIEQESVVQLVPRDDNY
jgi:5-bromo-4-chloroindolyl phosphate hydrolysis protein